MPTSTADLQLETERSLKALQTLLRGEVAAAETYELAVTKLGADAPPDLAICLNSHQKRIELLTVRIFELGGRPEDSSGLWGAFVRLVESGAALLGRSAAIGSLEEGEDHGLAEYRERLEDLDPESRRIVEAELLPEQLRTHELMSALCCHDGADDTTATAVLPTVVLAARPGELPQLPGARSSPVRADATH